MKCFFFSVLIFCTTICFAQIPLKSEEVSKTVRGFVYYWDERDLTLVPVKGSDKSLNFDDFCSDSLDLGYQLTLEGLNYYVPDWVEFGKKFQLFNFPNDSTHLTVIPVTATFIRYNYSMTKKQIKELVNTDIFKLSDRWVYIKTVGGLQLNVTSLEPLSLINKNRLE